MNEIIQSLYDRKSVRMFEKTPVMPEDKLQLLDCAAQAPTAGNQLLYTILDITDPALKAKLAVLCDNQPFIAAAPLVLVFAANGQRWHDCYRYAGCAPRAPGAGDLLLAFADACIAAQNVVVAAQSLGLGSCYIGDILEHKEQLQPLLGLPEHCVPACMLVIGYPTDAQRKRKKPARFSREWYVCENRYRALDRDRLAACYQDRCTRAGMTAMQPFEDYMQAFCARKYNSDFSREMSRSAAEYLKAFS